MTNIIREVVIKAPKQQVWDKISDFGNVYRMGPTISKSYLTSEKASGIDTTRHCDFTMMGASVEERVTGWDEGRRLEIGFDDWGNLPGIISMGAEFSLSDEGKQTRMRATMHYGVRNSLLGKTMDAVMLKPMNTKNWVNFVAGIRHHIETGEDVTKETSINMSDIIPVS
jgi:carbon monoxide dehydrogenase subunit G